MKVEKLISIARELLRHDKRLMLTGSLMLHIRGIDIGRKPHDLDVILKGCATKIQFPGHWKVEEVEETYGTIKYEYDGIVIDVLCSNEEPEVFSGWKLGSVQGLIGAKREYVNQNSEASQKHKEDLEVLLKLFPQQENDIPLIY